MDRACALAAAVDRGVESLVAWEPSPQFAARLRARLAEAPAPAAYPLLVLPRFAAAAFVAAAVLITALVMHAPHRPAEDVHSAANTSPRAVQRTPEKASAVPVQSVVVPRVAANHGPAGPRVRHGELPFEVLVPKGQLSAALVLSEGVSAGTIDGAQLVQLSARGAQPLEVKALDIAPLVPPAPSDGAAAPAGGDGSLK
ncbi:MAG TPA: hypothetical protein VLW54_06370 [Candidatus Acidoferrales bacterium]|nr:hypothetical protein [Candidatus Acidoferrales bacterium]